MQAAVIQSLAVRVHYIANAAEALRGILILYGPRDTGTVVGYLCVVEEGATDTAVRYQRVGQRCHRLPACTRRSCACRARGSARCRWRTPDACAARGLGGCS